MISRIFFWLIFTAGVCIAQQVVDKPAHRRLSTDHFSNNQIGKRLPLISATNQIDSAESQIDSVGRVNFSPINSTGSIKSDLLRSAIGSAIGGIVGVGIGGFIPVFLRGEFNSRDFPNDAFYLRSYVSASMLGALASAAALQLSKRREISYWKFASYSMIPSMLLVMPLSVYASVNPEREELVRSVWAASLVSIGISSLWTVLVYRMHPRNENGISLIIAGPYLFSLSCRQNWFGSGLVPGVKIIEVRF